MEPRIRVDREEVAAELRVTDPFGEQRLEDVPMDQVVVRKPLAGDFEQPVPETARRRRAPLAVGLGHRAERRRGDAVERGRKTGLLLAAEPHEIIEERVELGIARRGNRGGNRLGGRRRGNQARHPEPEADPERAGAEERGHHEADATEPPSARPSDLPDQWSARDLPRGEPGRLEAGSRGTMNMSKGNEHARRKFLAYFSGAGLTTTLFPGVLWARLQESGAESLNIGMMKETAALAGLEFTDEEYELMVDEVKKNFDHYQEMRQTSLDNSVPPPLYFNPVVPGMTFERFEREVAPECSARRSPVRRIWRRSRSGRRPSLARLIETREVSSLELTDMYLSRLERLNPVLNCRRDPHPGPGSPASAAGG